jgi:hypothetical protein
MGCSKYIELQFDSRAQNRCRLCHRKMGKRRSAQAPKHILEMIGEYTQVGRLIKFAWLPEIRVLQPHRGVDPELML